MAGAKSILTAVNFFLIIELIATYPRSNYIDGANLNTLYDIRNHEAVKLIAPALKTERSSYAEITANHLASTIYNPNNLSVEKDLHKTNGLDEISNPIDQLFIAYTKAFIRDSLKVIQNKVESATVRESTELLDILIKIKNLSNADEALVTKALYHTMEVMNEVNADLTFSESYLNWAEALLKHFEELLEQKRRGAHVKDIYESLFMVDDIEQNFDAVRLFWSNYELI